MEKQGWLRCSVWMLCLALTTLVAGAEREVVVQTDTFRLPGTLRLPDGVQGKVPCVVMVHGSGPNDRDETIGPNKLFRDLAEGLAAQGIATLRYDKRTKVYGAASLPQGREMDYDVEVVEDAVSAVKLAALRPEVDAGRIVVLGHSLGAMLAPRIAGRVPGVAALVMLAAPARKLPDLMIGQCLYLQNYYGKMPGVPQEALGQLEQLLGQARNAQRMGTPEYDEQVGLPAGLSRAYLEMDKAYSPVGEAAALKQPMMLVQGGRDYQVTLVDYALWCSGLMGRKDVTYKNYPKLNHLMREGEGISGPMEYAVALPTSAELMADIAEFVRGV